MTDKAKKSFWTTLPGVLTGLAALIASITALYLALGDRPRDGLEPPPDETVTEQAARNLESRFMTAYQNDRVSTILAMSSCPFYMLGDFLYGRVDLEEKLEFVFRQKGGNFKVLRSSIRTIGQLRQETPASQQVDEYGVNLASVVETLGLRDSDFVVEIEWSIQTYRGTMFLLTRVRDEDLVLAGWWATD